MPKVNVFSWFKPEHDESIFCPVVFPVIPSTAKRYYLTQYPFIDKWILSGVDVFVNNPLIPQYPAQINFEGRNYNVLSVQDYRHFRITLNNTVNRNIHFNLPLAAFVRNIENRPRLELGRYEIENLDTAKSYVECLQPGALVTVAPFIIPIQFYK